MTLLTGGVTENVNAGPDNSTGGIGDAINQVAKSALFMEALRNLNWSRGYCWYVELDGVPNPFQRGGVIGLPVTDVTIDIAHGKNFTWEIGTTELSVPLGSQIRHINITFIDDEQATLCTFFERWYNMIYNDYKGVLPVTEACKAITITKTKSTRSRITSMIRTYDGSDKIIQGKSFLVYPSGIFQEQEKIDNGPRTYNIDFVVVKVLDGDYGDPTKIQGVKSFMGKEFGITSGQGFLDKIADYI